MLSCCSHFNQETSLRAEREKVKKIMKLNKQVLVALIVIVATSSTVSAACANREKGDSSDLYEDIKCGLSTSVDKIKDVGSTVGTSLKDGTNKALDVISKAAVKTGSVLRDGYNVAIDSGKSGYDFVKDAITGQKDKGVIDVRGLNVTESHGDAKIVSEYKLK